MLFPVYEGTAVEYVSIPLDAAVDYTGDYVFYEYWPDSEYIPNDSGNTYYTFRLNGIWGMVLDCG